MKRYDSYKDSGVEWIGEIPKEWKTPRLKHSITESYGGEVIDKSYWGEGHETLYTTSKKIHKSDYPNFNNERRTTKRDLLLSRNGDGIVHIPDDGCIYTNVVQLVRIKDEVDRRFLWYSLTFQIKPLNSYSDGDFIVSLNKEQWFNLLTPLPPLPEQQQIVSFLDTKTSLIDSLIDKTQQKIELLKKKRTSLINEVVTKGLNPNVEMKDSGVEWIGEIPSHYQIGKLKHICNENQRSLSNSTNPNYELNYIEISDVNSEGVIGNHTPYIFSESPSRCRRVVQKGDVIVSTVRTYLKSIGLIEEEVEDLICSTGFSVLSPNIEINSKYLFYLLRTEWFISMVISKSEGVSYPSIQSEKLMNIDVVFCKISEQQQIVEYLDEQTQLIDNTISIEEKRIELLKEYRQSLISEVVTGKRKVV
jgi:type I restriction enzyme S subunit